MADAIATPPAPASAPITPPAPSIIEPDDDPFKSYEEGDAKPAPAPPKPVADKPEAKPPVPAKTPAKAPEAKPQAPEKKEEKPEQAPEKPKNTSVAWQKYHEAERRMKQLETELEQAKKSTAPNIKEHPEFKSVNERLEAVAKRNAELEEKIRYTDYEQSDEFQTQYHQPYLQACKEAAESMKELAVKNADGTTREAGSDDLWKLVVMTNTKDAIAAANELFGDPTTANYVIGLRSQIQQAWKRMEGAKAHYRGEGKKALEERARQMAEAEQRDAEEFGKLNEETIQKYPKWFQPDEGDEAAKALLEKGFKLADLAFSGQVPPEKKNKIYSAIRNKAGGFDHVVHKLNKANKRIAELESQLSGFQASQPQAGDGGGATGEEDDDPFKKFE